MTVSAAQKQNFFDGKSLAGWQSLTAMFGTKADHGVLDIQSSPEKGFHSGL